MTRAPALERLATATHGAEERPLGVAGEAAGVVIGVQVVFEVIVGRYGVLLAARLDVQGEGGADAGEQQADARQVRAISRRWASRLGST